MGFPNCLAGGELCEGLASGVREPLHGKEVQRVSSQRQRRAPDGRSLGRLGDGELCCLFLIG